MSDRQLNLDNEEKKEGEIEEVKVDSSKEFQTGYLYVRNEQSMKTTIKAGVKRSFYITVAENYNVVSGGIWVITPGGWDVHTIDSYPVGSRQWWFGLRNDSDKDQKFYLYAVALRFVNVG